MPKSRTLTKSFSTRSVHEHDVVRLQIAMDDVGCVRGSQALRDLLCDVGQAPHRHRPLGFAQNGGQALAVEELHDEIRRAVSELTEVADVDDVPIADCTRGACFLEEALIGLVIRRPLAPEHLDRDSLVDNLVAARVNDSHAAFAEDALDQVAPVDGPADVLIDFCRRSHRRAGCVADSLNVEARCRRGRQGGGPCEQSWIGRRRRRRVRSVGHRFSPGTKKRTGGKGVQRAGTADQPKTLLPPASSNK